MNSFLSEYKSAYRENYSSCLVFIRLKEGCMEEESESAVKSLKENNMIVNPDMFQALILKKGNKIKKTNNILNIENITIGTTKSLELLAETIDSKLNFEEHISVLRKKASLQLNGISRLQENMGEKEREAVTNIFIYSNFNYCTLLWHFCFCKSSNKVEQR